MKTRTALPARLRPLAPHLQLPPGGPDTDTLPGARHALLLPSAVASPKGGARPDAHSHAHAWVEAYLRSGGDAGLDGDKGASSRGARAHQGGRSSSQHVTRNGSSSSSSSSAAPRLRADPPTPDRSPTTPLLLLPPPPPDHIAPREAIRGRCDLAQSRGACSHPR
jgi:hypothetical protein